MADSIHGRMETAKEKIQSFRQQIGQKLNNNNDQKLGDAAKTASQQRAPVRSPPSIKVRRTLKGHFGKITATHWSGDSRFLITASQDGMLLLWNTRTTNKAASVILKSAYVMAVGLEPTHGDLAACGGLDNLCSVYRLDASHSSLDNNPMDDVGGTVTDTANASGDEAATIPPTPASMEMAGHDGFLSCCRFLNEQQIVTSSGDSSCILWDVDTGKPISTMAEHTADALWISLQPRDSGGGTPSVFCSCSVDQTVKVWDLRSPTQSVQTIGEGCHTGDINCVEFMPSDRNCVGTCSQDNTVRIFDLRAYQQINSFSISPPQQNGAGGIGEAAPTNTDPNKAAAGDDGDEEGDGNAGGIPDEGFTSLSWSRSGRVLCCGHADGSVHGFDALSGSSAPHYTINGAHEKHISCVAVSPRGDALSTASWDGVVKIWA